MRDIEAVLDALKAIPEMPEGVKSGIERIRVDSRFKAPEEQHISWRKLANLLEDGLAPVDTPWKEKAQRIFAGTE